MQSDAVRQNDLKRERTLNEIELFYGTNSVLFQCYCRCQIVQENCVSELNIQAVIRSALLFSVIVPLISLNTITHH